MKRRIILLLAGLALFSSTAQLFAQYNRDAVVTVMRSSLTLIGEINDAANSQDFDTAAVKLMALAEGFKSLEAVSPPKGSKAEWDRIHNELIAAASRGIEACRAKDAKGLQAEIGRIMALNREGHRKFR